MKKTIPQAIYVLNRPKRNIIGVVMLFFILLLLPNIGTAQKITPLNFDSTVVTPGENGIPLPVKTRAKSPIITPNTLASVKVGEADVVQLDSSALEIITLGQDNIPFPKKYNIPDSGYSIQYGDTIYTPNIINVKQPKMTAAEPPRYKDNAAYNIKILDVDQGLPTSFVRSIIQDKKGNFWFSSYFGGVTRYDGNSFTTYTTEHGLVHNYVWTIYEDGLGILWFGTTDGLSRFDGMTFTNFTVKNGLPNNSIKKITADTLGNVWVGTYNGIACFDNKSFTIFSKEQGFEQDEVNGLLCDKKGNIWIAYNQSGVIKFNGTTVTRFNVDNGLIDNKVGAIHEDHLGNIWIGTPKGISRFNGELFSNLTSKHGIPNSSIRSIVEDRDGAIWFGTKKEGAFKLEGKELTQLTKKQGLSNGAIATIVEDQSNNMWFGTLGGGISQFKKKSFINYSQAHGLPAERICSIFEVNDRLFFSSNDGGIALFDGKSFTSFTENQGLSFNVARIMIPARNKDCWIEVRGGKGVDFFDGEYFTHYTTETGLITNLVSSIIEDRKENIWFGFFNEDFARFDGKSFIHYHQKSRTKPLNVVSMYEAKNGDIWIATTLNGTIKYNGTSFTKVEGIPNNNIWSIYEDKDGNMWFGTIENGVIRYDGEKVMSFGKNEGFTNKSVWSIVQDQDENLWIGTFSGLYRFRESDASPHGYIIDFFNKSDGLQAEDIVERSGFIDSKNRAWWGTSKGLTMLDLNHFRMPEKPPTIQMNSIDLNGNFIDYREYFNSPKTFIENDTSEVLAINFSEVVDYYNYPTGLRLPFNINHLTFHYSALDWVAPHKIKYQFMLEGLDEDWSDLTEETKVDYRSLPHGTFTFKVKAIGAARKWSDTFSYQFTISPPWWLTWWAYVIYITIPLLLFYTFHRVRLTDLKKQKVKLEDEVRDRMGELIVEKEKVEAQAQELLKLDKAKTVFFTNVSHEFRTPLTVIINAIGKIKESLKSPENLRLSKMVKKNANSLKGLITEILEYSKLEAGSVAIKREPIELVSLFQNQLAMMQSLLEEKEITLKKEFQSEMLWATVDEEKLTRILNNIISNAIKYTNQKGNIEVNLELVDDTTLQWIVKDFGVGIAEDKLLHVFERFYRVENDQQVVHEGTGIGLSYVKDLVDLLGGTISLESELGKGTEVTFTLPYLPADPLVDSKKVIATNEEWAQEIPTKDAKEKILLVEDNVDIHYLIKEELENDYVVQSAYDGQQGIELALKELPDIIISDVMMPNKSGLELCEALKTDIRSSHIPIVLLTARATQEEKLEGLELQADDYLTKPFDNQELKIRIKNLLKGRALIREKFTNEAQFKPEEVSMMPKDQLFLTNVLDTLSHKFGDPLFGAEDFASEMNLSKSQLNRKLSALVNQSANKMIQSFRLQKAKELLLSESFQVTDVADKVGFSSRTYFTKCFKEKFEKSPSDYLEDSVS